MLKAKAGFLLGAGYTSFLISLYYVFLIFEYCIGDAVKMAAMLTGLVFFILFGILLVYEGDKELEYIKQEEKRKREEMK